MRKKNKLENYKIVFLIRIRYGQLMGFNLHMKKTPSCSPHKLQ